MMNKKILSSNMGMILALGSIWGLSEVIMGMWLHKCAHLYSGAIMTGLAFFYMSFVWTVTRKLLPLVILLVTVSIFKMLDAWLLSAPIISGSVANPMFAFFLEILAFMLIVGLLGQRFQEKRNSRVLAGGGAALVAVFLFPLVGVFTGIPACLYPASQVPLSVATAPVAIIISLVTVPLGFIVAEKYTNAKPREENYKANLALKYGLSPLVILLCLVILTMNRFV